LVVSRRRALLALALTGVVAPSLHAQELPPSGLARVELERSRQCVEVLARIDALEGRLEPLADRSERLMQLGNAVALEDVTQAGTFDRSVPLEARVASWFEEDQRLAARYLEAADDAVLVQRAIAREAIKDALSEALVEVQSEADARIAEAGTLTTTVGGCDGAILVRPAVLEACATAVSPVCEPARNPGTESRYRFVDNPLDLWEVEEVRPWTTPGPLGITADGQLGGARTMGYARSGNLTLTLQFAPLFGTRDDFTPEQIARYRAMVDSVGFEFEHPDVTFVPSLAVRASVPEPLADETLYVLHFDEPDNADILWSGPAGTGETVEAVVALGPRHLARLGSGHPVRFTAVMESPEEDAGDVVYSVQFTPINQSPATSALMGYMAGQMSVDLRLLVPTQGR